MLILPAMRQLRAVRLLCTVFTLLSAPNSRVAATAFPRPHPSMIRAPLPVVGSQKKFWAQEVPGDGACLFHTIGTKACSYFLCWLALTWPMIVCSVMLCFSTLLAAAVRYQEKGEHSNFDQSLYNLSHQLRQLACDTLACENVPLYLGEQEESTTTDILNMIAKQYNTTGPGYCELMRQPREWGGGPEIVALSNVLRQPVHVYELYTRRFFPTRFLLRPAARFGSPKFDSNAKEPLCILCADGRLDNIILCRPYTSCTDIVFCAGFQASHLALKRVPAITLCPFLRLLLLVAFLLSPWFVAALIMLPIF